MQGEEDYDILSSKWPQDDARRGRTLLRELTAERELEDKQSKLQEERDSLVICAREPPEESPQNISKACLAANDKIFARKRDADLSFTTEEKKGVYDRVAKACQFGDLWACYQEAAMKVEGYGTEKDAKKGKQNLNNALKNASDLCNECDDAVACNQLGKFSFTVRKDSKAAVQLWGKACSLGEAEACHNVGVNFYNKKQIGFEDYFEKGCNLGNITSCAYLAHHKIDLDLGSALKLAAKACDSGHCEGNDPAFDLNFWLSEMYERNQRVDLRHFFIHWKNYNEATKYAWLSCQNCKFARGCLKIGYWYDKGLAGLGKSKEQAQRFYREGCQLGNLEACVHLGCLSEDRTTPDIMDFNV